MQDKIYYIGDAMPKFYIQTIVFFVLLSFVIIDKSNCEVNHSKKNLTQTDESNFEKDLMERTRIFSKIVQQYEVESFLQEYFVNFVGSGKDDAIKSSLIGYHSCIEVFEIQKAACVAAAKDNPERIYTTKEKPSKYVLESTTCFSHLRMPSRFNADFAMRVICEESFNSSAKKKLSTDLIKDIFDAVDDKTLPIESVAYLFKTMFFHKERSKFAGLSKNEKSEAVKKVYQDDLLSFLKSQLIEKKYIDMISKQLKVMETKP